MAYIFPKSLGELGSGLAGKPFVNFTPYKNGALGEPVFLPVPAGVQFADGAKFNEVDMGVIGEALPNEGESMVEGAKGAVSRNVNWANVARLGKLKGAEFLMSVTGQERAKASVATKLIINPNTNTSFEGNTIRQFQFEFTLVGRTQEDSVAIRDICNYFREYIYPENTADGSNVILEYPWQWQITFHDGPGGAQNQWMPKPYFCYLVTMTSSYNPSALMYRVDGSPAEISLSLNFQESRSLTRADIVARKAGG